MSLLVSSGGGVGPITASDITDSSASGRTVLTGTAAQARTALGVGSGVDAAALGFRALSEFGPVDTTGATDCTETLRAALAAIYASGGGTLRFPSGTIRIAGQIIIPNDGGGVFQSGAQLQPSIYLMGAGAHKSGQEAPQLGGTILNMTYQDVDYEQAKLCTYGQGHLTIQDLSIVDTTANSSTPFIKTTNTTLSIFRVCFRGSTVDANCAQDAIVLGGTKKGQTIDEDFSALDGPFQGYGTTIDHCYFENIRRVVFGRSYCNHVSVIQNFIDKSCGSNLVDGAAIEFNGSLDPELPASDGDYCTGNWVAYNYIQTIWYPYGVKLKKCIKCVVAFNGFVDPSTVRIADVRCESANGVDSPAEQNYVMCNFSEGGVPLSEDSVSSGKNSTFGCQNAASLDFNHQNLSANDIFSRGILHAARMTFQPVASQPDGSAIYEVKRSAAESTNPSEVIETLYQNGKREQTSFGSETGNVAGPYYTFSARGRKWESKGTHADALNGGDLTASTGPGNSWFNIHSYGHRFYDANGTTLRARIGAGEDKLELGSASDAAVKRAAAGIINLGKLAVTNSAAATTPGSCVKKIEVFDGSGTSLGFIPVYSSIT